jgi:hypothetical protein
MPDKGCKVYDDDCTARGNSNEPTSFTKMHCVTTKDEAMAKHEGQKKILKTGLLIERVF